MKIAFLIDKAQTVQSVAGVLIEATQQGHECVVFSTCKSGQSAVLTDFGLDASKIIWLNLKDRYDVVEQYLRRKSSFDATFGINMFNGLMSSVYLGAGSDVYSFEHCWNNFYNYSKDFDSQSTLLANSDWSAKNLQEISGYPHVKCVGSQWFELIKRFKRPAEDYVVFAGPHSRFHGRKPECWPKIENAVNLVRSYCDDRGLKMVLKTREKFGRGLSSSSLFDNVVSDGNAFDHLQLYGGAKCVFHFCSSAVNEVTFLEVPHVCLLPDIYTVLHDHKPHTYEGMKRISAQYYTGKIIDGVHSLNVMLDDLSKIDDRYDDIDRLIESEHDWAKVQAEFFPGVHDGAAKRILETVQNA